MSVLGEIARWKLEAKLEDNQRYFYNTAEVASLTEGGKCFVIGRKGTGKTAIREHLTQNPEPRRFVEKLTFKNFPFNDLYQHANARYTPPNQYITLWKWLIYCHVAKMMTRNEAINPALRTEFEKAFPSETVPALARSVGRLTSREFRLSFFGVELAATAKRETDANPTPWIERCDVLEKLIAENLDESSYQVVFDELDEDYRDVHRIERLEEYTALLTSLFKAVQDIRATFQPPRYRVHPIVFLRDDIYSVLRDSDKTKWNDFKLELRWSSDQLNNMLAFRFSRAARPAQRVLDLAAAVPLVFRNTEMTGEPYGRSPLAFMQARSLQRPRDLVSFCQIAAQIAVDRHRPHIAADVLKSAEVPYSAYLRSDLEDELVGTLPDVSAVFDVLAAIRRRNFEVARFTDGYKAAVSQGKVADRDPTRVLEVLFQFSIVGNNVRGGGSVFRYRNPLTQFNPREQVTVLPGLQATLNIPWR